MKTSTAFSLALLGFAVASPVALPQDIDFDSYESIPVAPDLSAPIGAPVVAPVVTTYDATSAASIAVAAATAAVDADLTKRETSVKKRGSCLPATAGNGPTISPDTDTAFLNSDKFSSAARGATAPPGYFLVVGFQNLAASASNPSYQTYISDTLTSYDPQVCANKCGTIKGCISFNIYYERDPTIDVDSDNCATATSLTRIKCAFFGSAITVADATNVGQYTGDFHVVIAGSNTYTTAPQPLPGYTGPVSINNASIISPTIANTYMGVQSFLMTQPYDPSVCAATCTEKSAYNIRHAVPGVAPRLCKFFDAYILYKNGAGGVFTCTYYTQVYDASYATNFGQYNTAGDRFTIGHSYIYSNLTSS